MGHAFETSHEIIVPATPEEVWDAIATGPGIDSWFMGRSTVEPGEGGKTSMSMGDMLLGESTVTAWRPPHHFKHEGAPAEDGSFMAFDYLVEGREGGSTVVRLVHSGFLPGDDWETEYDALRKGNPLYLATLGQYLEHFKGRTAVPVTAWASPQADEQVAWRKVCGALGLQGEVKPGDAVRLTLGGTEVTGVVDTVLEPSFLGVRTDDALLRFVGRGGMMGAGHHLFTEADEKTTTATWQAWLNTVFA